MAAIRIFSYLPNPRIWKATVTGRLCNVDIELRGAPIPEMPAWLWDFDARPLNDNDHSALAHFRRGGKTGFSTGLIKTDSFLKLNPFGAVPVAFDPGGTIGIFESNSIMRAVARLGGLNDGLYGHDPFTASRIDSFLDASLVLGRDSQPYLLTLLGGTISALDHSRAAQSLRTYMEGIELALHNGPFIAGEVLTLADICFVAEFALLHNELPRHRDLQNAGLDPILGAEVAATFPAATQHFWSLVGTEAFSQDCRPYLLKLGAVHPQVGRPLDNTSKLPGS